jgi:hypothetical protein
VRVCVYVRVRAHAFLGTYEHMFFLYARKYVYR